MKRFLPVLVAAAALGCTSSTPPAAPAPAPATTAPNPTLEERAKTNVKVQEALGIKPPADVDDDTPVDPVPYVDPATGKRLLRLPKGGQYFEKDGRVFLAIVNSPGFPILSQDETAFIVEAPPERKKPDPNAKKAPAPEDLKPIIELPQSEAGVVTPKVSKDPLRFEEISAGLPRSGMWRENFDMGDVLGLGHPQIVAPPARLTGATLKVFRLDKDDAGKWRWREVPLELENPDKIDAAYGAAAVADMDGDGKLDIVFGGHGSGPAIAFNKGAGKFSIESRGLPRQLSTRAIAIGDLNGDGKKDLLVVSDDPEWIRTGGVPVREADGYLRGFDVRAFLSEGSTFRDVHTGLEGACFGYAVAVALPRDASAGLPFYTSGCRYTGATSNLYEFDPKAEEFRYVGVGVIEGYGQASGAAAGTYMGRPALFASWFKRTPSGGAPKIDGQGITVYYRGADGKVTGKRIVKTLQYDSPSPAIVAGDLNGDGLDDVVWADESAHKVRVLFQNPGGEFEELAADREPSFVNHPTSLRIADVDGDGQPDVVLMYQYLTGDETRAGGFRVFRGLGK
ncbi:MAG: VCBS repeat-containing protein [Acidobacteria bacterium]|nr:VCBS repeat-containing protein [Acidobacteriota bacterium]